VRAAFITKKEAMMYRADSPIKLTFDQEDPTTIETRSFLEIVIEHHCFWVFYFFLSNKSSDQEDLY